MSPDDLETADTQRPHEITSGDVEEQDRALVEAWHARVSELLAPYGSDDDEPR